MSCNSDSDLNSLVLEKISLGESLIKSTNQFQHIQGLSKLQRKIKQELDFLQKIYKNGTAKKEHLQCSNLTHFSALINVLHQFTNSTDVCKVYMFGQRKITVDIVCENGLHWIKVIARNPKSLNQICMGDASYGVRTVLDQAEEFLECAQLHPCLFQTPTITFIFANGIGQSLATKIESLGIRVQGERLPSSSSSSSSSSICDDDNPSTNSDEKDDQPIRLHQTLCNNDELTTQNIDHIKRVNLDVSAMLAYCSSVTNGGAYKYDFAVNVLAQQAEWERQRPQKPILDQFFNGKKLYCCQTAYENFINIINTVGGLNEKKRAEEFLKRVTVLSDNATTTTDNLFDNDDVNDGGMERFEHVQFKANKNLMIGGKIRQRSLIIFTFGDRIQAVTVTANDGFVRSAKQQGINFVVFVHESRALTEQKELTKATIVNSK